MTDRRITFSVSDRIARITLANAPRRNAIDGAFCEAFAAAAASCAADPAIAVILLAAEGEMFSVGGDFRDFVAHRDTLGAHVRAMAALFHEGVMRLRRAPAPVVAAVNGMAAGGGFSLVCGADMVIAGRSARFVSAYTRAGLTPDGGLSFFLPRIVGARRAFDLMARNSTLTAEEAHSVGLISQVLDDADFAAEVERTIAELAATPACALAGLKRLLARGTHAELEAHLAAEAKSIARHAGDPATLARLDAFLARNNQRS